MCSLWVLFVFRSTMLRLPRQLNSCIYIYICHRPGCTTLLTLGCRGFAAQNLVNGKCPQKVKTGHPNCCQAGKSDPQLLALAAHSEGAHLRGQKSWTTQTHTNHLSPSLTGWSSGFSTACSAFLPTFRPSTCLKTTNLHSLCNEHATQTALAGIPPIAWYQFFTLSHHEE